MTHILVFKSKQGDYLGFNCIGHAEFGNVGEDIVCAAVSILVINTVNSLEELAEEDFSIVSNEEEGLIDCRFDHVINDKSKLLLDSMLLGLNGIREQYGNSYLNVTIEEV